MTENYTSIITKLLESKITSYKIAKDTGLSTQLIDKYRTGNGKINNMRLDTAETLVNYAKKKKKIVSITKTQYENMARNIKNVESAKEFLGSYIFDWSNKETALNTFKHAVLNAKNEQRIIKDLPRLKMDDIDWLKEITIDDVVDK